MFRFLKKIFSFRKQKQKEAEELARHITILNNVINYDGTEKGQKDVR